MRCNTLAAGLFLFVAIVGSQSLVPAEVLTPKSAAAESERRAAGDAEIDDPETARQLAEPLLHQPWTAAGRVTDASGKPLRGVEIRAFCGVGSLFQAGQTTSDDDGRYELRFGPSSFSSASTFVQAATIYAAKPGYFEQNLNRQGGCVAATGQPGKAELANWGEQSERLFLPGQPRTIDFVMQEAAVVKGEFIETSHDWNVREQSFYIIGEELPPSSSVLRNVETDRHGKFRIDDLPTGRAWRIGMRVPQTGLDVETEPFTIEEPGNYRCRLLFEATDAGRAVELALRIETLEPIDRVQKIDRLDERGFSALHRAAMAGEPGRVRELIEAGANVNVRQRKFRGTPLQYAAHKGHGDTVQVLLDHGAAVDARDANERTPLIWASMGGHGDVIERLLAAGADANAANSGGWTPLHYAAEHDHTESARLLIGGGANPITKNSQGKTPVDLNPQLDLAVPWRSLRQ
jgi:Ankyrin repeats (3 copies)/Ankyrin repeat